MCRLQALLAELLPGQAKQDITTGQAKAMLATVRRATSQARPAAASARKNVKLIAVEAKIKKATAELKSMVLARESRPVDIHGVGLIVAARVLAGIGDIRPGSRADRNRFVLDPEPRPWMLLRVNNSSTASHEARANGSTT